MKVTIEGDMAGVARRGRALDEFAAQFRAHPAVRALDERDEQLRRVTLAVR